MPLRTAEPKKMIREQGISAFFLIASSLFVKISLATMISESKRK